MEIPRHIFREYDIRGVADRDLGDALVHDVGRAVASLLEGDNPHVAVGRDCRASSDRLFAALTNGLIAAGCRVTDIGLGPTPLLYFAAHHLSTDGAVMITGSHNAPQDNGFKMMRGKNTLFGADIQQLLRRIEASDFVTRSPGSRGQTDVSDAYVAAVRDASQLESPNNLEVVVDAGNGAAGPLGVRTLEALGVAVDPLFCDMDGAFPNHHPDPTVEANLEALKARVLERGARLGVAWDGDGDRIGVVDEAGNVVWGDKLLILFARQVLKHHKGAAVLGEVKCSETLFDDIRNHGGNAVVCRTGHSLIKKRMKEEGALLAGEMSGHIFFADRYFGFDDGIYAAIRLLEIIARTGKNPGALLADVPRTAVTPEIRRDCPDDIKFSVVDRVLAHYRATHDVLDIDGARISFGDGAWGLCRASNTGPVLVLRFEAGTEARRDAIRAEVEEVVARATAELTTT